MNKYNSEHSALHAKEPQELLENAVSEAALELALLHQGLEQIDQGISIFDKSLKLVAANAQFTRLLDFPKTLGESGTRLKDIFRYNAQRGEYGPGDPETLMNDRLRLAHQQQAHCFQRTRPDGSVLEIRGNPIEDFGFVTTYTDITERVRSTEALQSSRQRFQDMACAASDWFWELDAKGCFTFISERFFTAVGIMPQEVLGRRRDDIADPLDLESETNKWKIYQQKLDDHQSFRDFEYRFRGAFGKVFHLRVSGVPVYDSHSKFVGYRGTGTDVTLLKEAQQALEVSEKRLASILESSIAGVCISHRTSDQVLFATPRLENLIGFDEGSLKNGIIRDLLYGEGQWEALVQQMYDEGPLINKDVRLRRKDGSLFWALVTLKRTQFESKECILTWVYDITELHENQEKLAYLANHDTLTGLSNRRHFEDHVTSALGRAQRNEKLGALIYFDLDNFKPVNDTYGHDFGDWLLKEAARRVKSGMRRNDLVCRLGGDEFVVLVQDLDDKKEVFTVADKILDWIKLPFFHESVQVKLTTSVGIAYFDGPNIDADTLIIMADRAMYRAKSEGKGTIRVSNPNT